MTRAEACLAKAAECERAAVLASEPNIRATYSDLAKQWRELAAHAEALDRKRSGKPNESEHCRLSDDRWEIRFAIGQNCAHHYHITGSGSAQGVGG